MAANTDGTGTSGPSNQDVATPVAVKPQVRKFDADGFELPTYKTKVFILSAMDKQACEKMVSGLKEYLQQKDFKDVADADLLLQSLSYTLDQRRTLFLWVAASVVPFTRGADEVIEALDTPNFAPHRSSRRPRIGMIFTGDGAQWHAMGRQLIPSYPPFKASLKEADGYLKDLGADWSLMEELNRDAESSRVDGTSLAIPTSVALQISLVRLLRCWGITTTAVTSHSSGEIAAAWTVGAISYRQAMAIAYYRAALLAADPTLRAPISGGSTAAAMTVDEYREALRDILDREMSDGCLSSIVYTSPVTGGRVVAAGKITDPEHWVSSLTQPVQFAAACTAMGLGDPDGVDILIEVGPQTALRDSVREICAQPIFRGPQLPYLGCLSRDTNARDSMQALAASLLRAGHPLNMEAINFPFGKWPHLRVLADLPPYLWDY